jgi:putative copper resistance protein D
VVLRRFSGLGHFAVALLVATGVVNTLLVPGPDVDLGSTYWQLLLAKLAIAATMCTLAIINRYVHLPRMREHGIHALVRGTAAELALGTTTIGIVSVLGMLSPR